MYCLYDVLCALELYVEQLVCMCYFAVSSMGLMSVVLQLIVFVFILFI